MKPEARFFFLLGLLLIVGAGVIILLFITTTPRAVLYDLSLTECPEQIDDAPAAVCTTLYRLLYKYNIIREEELDDTDNVIPVYDTLYRYTDDPGDVEVTVLSQACPKEVTNMREYMRYLSSEERELVFVDAPESSDMKPGDNRKSSRKEYDAFTIEAYNKNLRSRQTAVFVFFNRNGKIKGYALSNVWLRPRRVTKLTVVIGGSEDEDSAGDGNLGFPFLIADLDNNITEYEYENSEWAC